MKAIICIASLMFCLLLATGSSQATVINFSDLSAPGSGFTNLGTSVTHDGFTFSSTAGIYGGALGVWQNSSPNHPSGVNSILRSICGDLNSLGR